MRSIIIALGLAALLVAAPVHAKSTGFQVEAQGIGAQPVWSGSSGTAGLGGGTGARVLFGLSRRLLIGASVAYFKNEKEYAYAVVIPGPPTGGLRAPRRQGVLLGGPGRRVLSTLPLDAVMQLRTDRTTPLNLYAEIGGGVMSTRAKLTLGTVSASGIEQDPSILLGGGLIYGLGRNWEITAALDWHQAWSTGGRVWAGQDSPRFATFGLGIRYPKF